MSKIVQFAREGLGLKLYPGQAEMLEAFEAGKFQQAVWQCGRGSGKSLMADVLALYDALARDHLRAKLRPGEYRIAGIVSPKQDGSRDHIRNIEGLIEQNAWIKPLVANITLDDIEFTNRAVIRSYTCSARGLRGGPRRSSVILDELGHFLTAEDGNAAGQLVYQAVQPSLGVFGNEGWLIAISTPMWRQGQLWTLVQRGTSGRFPYIHYVKRPTVELNPTPENFLTAERVKIEDPAEYAREYLAEFVEGISSYLPEADVLGAKRETGILPPVPGVRYMAAIDPAYQHDNFALAIGHKEGKRLVIDGVWIWWRKGHEFTIGEIAAFCHQYEVQEVRTDQHAPVPIREALEKHRIAVKYVPWTNELKTESFNRLKVNLSLGMLSLPDDKELISELLALEARPTAGGFTRIAGVGGKDDRAVCVASVIQALERSDEIAIVFAGDDESMLQGLSDGDDLTDWQRLLVDQKAPKWLT